VDDGFHRIPLVPGCLKALQHVLPCAVGAAQCHLSNEVDSLACAAQYDGRGPSDTQLRIDWKVRHGSLAPQLPPEFHTPLNRCLTRACCGSHCRAIASETIKLAIVLNQMPLDRNRWVVG